MLESRSTIIPVFYNVNPSELRWTLGANGVFAWCILLCTWGENGVYVRALCMLEKKSVCFLPCWRGEYSSPPEVRTLKNRPLSRYCKISFPFARSQCFCALIRQKPCSHLKKFICLCSGLRQKRRANRWLSCHQTYFRCSIGVFFFWILLYFYKLVRILACSSGKRHMQSCWSFYITK